MNKLDQININRLLGALDSWQVRDDKLIKDFKFGDFKEAFKFMSALAPEADRRNHHPDWSNSYNVVSISLTSHDVGGLTERDFELAAIADKLAG